MRILVLHNDYGRYSGEEAVVDRLVADFESMGHEVRQVRPSTAGLRGTLWGNILGFFAGIYSPRGVRMVKRALREFRPNVVHVHNLYPFLSPACLFACHRSGARVLMTVHNYRLICPTGLFLREGKPCEECLACGNERPCLRHNCEGSRLRTLGYGLRNMVARRSGAYLKNVDLFCCLTQFQKSKLVEAGFPEEKMVVIPNYFDNSIEPPKCFEGSQPFVGYVGRLSHEKGYDLLVEVARRHPEIPFRLAGEVREEEHPLQLPNVEYCGLLDKDALEQFYRQAAFLAQPSRCYEGFPLVIPEAFAHGLPLIVPQHGPFPDLVTDGGRCFAPGDVDSLEKQVVALWQDGELRQALSQQARELYLTRYSPSVVQALWQVNLRSRYLERE